MLDINRLRILREISIRGTVTSAAKALWITPPSVSHHMAMLEQETGVQLLERVGRRVRLTEAGRRLVENTEAVLSAIEHAEADLAKAHTEVSGPLGVSSFQTAARAIVVPAAAEAMRRHPRLRISILELDYPQSFVELRSGLTDIAVGLEYTLSPMAPEAGLDLVPLLDEPMYIALPASHPLASAAFGLRDLKDETWIALRPPSEDYEAMLRAAAFAGFEPKLLPIETAGYEVMLAAVAEGLGPMMLPHLGLSGDLDGIVIRPIPDVPIRRKVFAAVREGRRETPAVAEMLACMQIAAEKVERGFEFG